MMSLDPLALPIATIVRPFKMAKLTDDQAQLKHIHTRKTTKDFDIPKLWRD